MTPPATGTEPRLLVFVHQFFPQFHAGTETLCERVVAEAVRMGWRVDLVTSVLVDRVHLAPLLASPLLDAAARALLERDDPPLGQPLRYTHAGGVEVHAFTHSHDPRHGRPRFRREVAEPAIESAVARLLAAHAYARALVFHQLHLPDRALALVADAGVPISFVATDFFAVCPIGSQQLDDGSDCPGPGRGSVACVRHLSDRTGRVKWWQDRLPAPLLGFYLWLWRIAGPWPRLPVHPWQNLWYLLERNRRSRRFLRSCALVVAPSARIERSLAASGAPRDRLRRMPYGMPPPTDKRPVERLTGPDLRLAFIGAVNERKGLHLLLDALGRLPETATVTLDVWGDFAASGAYGAAAQAAARALGPRVRLRGTFPSAAIHDVLREADFLVIPSTWAENLPLVLLSALQVGLPVVIARAEGLLDAFPDGRVHGRVFAMNDAADLACVLAEEIAARHPWDPEAAPRVPTVAEFAAFLIGTETASPTRPS